MKYYTSSQDGLELRIDGGRLTISATPAFRSLANCKLAGGKVSNSMAAMSLTNLISPSDLCWLFPEHCNVEFPALAILVSGEHGKEVSHQWDYISTNGQGFLEELIQEGSVVFEGGCRLIEGEPDDDNGPSDQEIEDEQIEKEIEAFYETPKEKEEPTEEEIEDQQIERQIEAQEEGGQES